MSCLQPPGWPPYLQHVPRDVLLTAIATDPELAVIVSLTVGQPIPATEPAVRTAGAPPGPPSPQSPRQRERPRPRGKRPLPPTLGNSTALEQRVWGTYGHQHGPSVIRAAPREIPQRSSHITGGQTEVQEVGPPAQGASEGWWRAPKAEPKESKLRLGNKRRFRRRGSSFQFILSGV